MEARETKKRFNCRSKDLTGPRISLFGGQWRSSSRSWPLIILMGIRTHPIVASWTMDTKAWSFLVRWPGRSFLQWRKETDHYLRYDDSFPNDLFRCCVFFGPTKRIVLYALSPFSMVSRYRYWTVLGIAINSSELELFWELMQTLEGEKCNLQGCKLDVLNQEGFKVT